MSTLDNLYEALQNGNSSRAVELIGDLDEEFDRLSERERPRKRVAQAVLMQNQNGSHAAETAEEYVNKAREVQKLRLELGYYLLALTEGEDTQPEEVLNKTKSLVDTQQKLEKQEQSLQSVKNESGVPAQLYLTGPGSIERGEGIPVTAELMLENVGADTANNVTISSGSSFVELSPSEISALDPDDSQSVQITVSSEPVESQELSIQAQGDGTSSSHSIQLLVADQLAYLERAEAQLTDLRETVETKTSAQEVGDPQAVPPIDTTEDLLTAITLIKQTVNELSQRITKDNIDDQSIAMEITRLISLLDEFIEATSELEEETVQPTAAGIVRQDAHAVIRTLERANTQMEESSILEYVTQDGFVQLDGLREAIADWRNTDVTDELLSQVTTVWIEQKEVD